jgi:undecaprenyl-diphosphatase
MNIFQAIILGAVQGITEFLPISSSGHLVLLQKILGIGESALLFDTLVHGGTLVAVFIVLRKDIWAILKRPIQAVTGYLIIATIPAVVFALAFKDTIEAAFVSGAFLGSAFLITSALLFLSEILSQGPGKKRDKQEMNWRDSLIIGLLQGVAIVPGVSRSGATLSGALSRKLDRDFAARFSFLLSIPAILGALVLQVKDLPAQGGAALEGVGTAALLAGTVTAAAVGFISVKVMLRVVRKYALWGFALYTAVLGVLILGLQYLGKF